MKGKLEVFLARQYAKLYPQNLFITITGSWGKSICVEFSRAVLSQKYNTISTYGNSDCAQLFTKLLLKLKPSNKKVLLETGIQTQDDVAFYLSLVRPNTIVLTKIDYSHSDKLRDLNGIVAEYTKLVESLDEKGLAILNFDDPNCKKLAKLCKGSVMYFGTDGQNCTVWAGNIRIENFRTTFELNLGVERVKVSLPLCGLHLVYPALAAAALGVRNSIPLTKIKLGLESILPMEHRMQVLVGPNDSIILDDTLNSQPSSLDGAIETLMQINARRRVLVLGEMKGLGGYSDGCHRQVAQKIFKEKIDQVFLGGGEALTVDDELKSLGFLEERLSSNLNSSQIVGRLLKVLKKGDVVLIKGSYSVRLDEVVKRIARRYR